MKRGFWSLKGAVSGKIVFVFLLGFILLKASRYLLETNNSFETWIQIILAVFCASVVVFKLFVTLPEKRPEENKDILSATRKEETM